VRRIVAYTAGDARAAIAEGDRLAAEVEAVGKLPESSPEFEKKVVDLKTAVRVG